MNDVINVWPLVLIIEDCYCPQTAKTVLEAAKTLPEELINASQACDGYAADMDAQTRQN